MSQADADKWNQRFREGAYSQRTHPSALLVEWLPHLRVETRLPQAADIGCGAGRNALHLARNGWSVTAFDISDVGLERLSAAAARDRLPIECRQADLESGTPLSRELSATRQFDLLLMIRYTNLPLIERLKSVLQPGGYLIVELHLQSDADVIGPRNPQFRVAPNALREAAQGLTIVEYREGLVDEPDGRRAALAQLLARA